MHQTFLAAPRPPCQPVSQGRHPPAAGRPGREPFDYQGFPGPAGVLVRRVLLRVQGKVQESTIVGTAGALTSGRPDVRGGARGRRGGTMAVFLVVMASGAVLAGLIGLVAGLGMRRRQNRRDRSANRGEPVIGVTR